MDQNREIGNEVNILLQPRTLEQALEELDGGTAQDKFEGSSESFVVDENVVFKLEGASLTITSK
jgi:hypothetical protein